MVKAGRNRTLALALVLALILGILPVGSIPVLSFPSSLSGPATLPDIEQGAVNRLAGDITMREETSTEWGTDIRTFSLTINKSGVTYSTTPTVELNGVTTDTTTSITSDRTRFLFAIRGSDANTDTVVVRNIRYDVATDTVVSTVNVSPSVEGTPTISFSPSTVVNARIVAAPTPPTPTRPTFTARAVEQRDVITGRTNQPAGSIDMSESTAAAIGIGRTISISVETTGIAFAERPRLVRSANALRVTNERGTLSESSTTATWTVEATSTADNTTLRAIDIRLNVGINVPPGAVNIRVRTNAEVDVVRPVVQPAIAIPFPDVPITNFAVQAISSLKARTIVNGYPDGLFRPKNNISRAELTKIVVEARGLTLINPATPSFKDVSRLFWAYPYIETARAAGIVTGYPDGNFNPNADITRAELSAILVRAGGLRINTSGSRFPDVREIHWAFEEIMTARNNNIIQGFPDGTFRPDEPADRDQAALMVFNWLRVLP